MSHDDQGRKLTEEMKGFYDEFFAESDRSAIILAAAEINDLLEIILKKSLKGPYKSGDDKLFDVDRPLYNLNAKIEMSYRLGIICGDFYKGLIHVSKIRNDFAHKRGINLNEDPLKGKVGTIFLHFNKPYFVKRNPELELIFRNEDKAEALKGLLLFIIITLRVGKEFTKEIFSKFPKFSVADNEDLSLFD